MSVQLTATTAPDGRVKPASGTAGCSGRLSWALPETWAARRGALREVAPVQGAGPTVEGGGVLERQRSLGLEASRAIGHLSRRRRPGRPWRSPGSPCQPHWPGYVAFSMKKCFCKESPERDCPVIVPMPAHVRSRDAQVGGRVRAIDGGDGEDLTTCRSPRRETTWVTSRACWLVGIDGHRDRAAGRGLDVVDDVLNRFGPRQADLISSCRWST